MSDAPKYVEVELFTAAMRVLIKMVLTAHRDAEFALLMLQEASPLPEATVQRIRGVADARYEQSIRAIDEISPNDALAFLRGFDGPVQ